VHRLDDAVRELERCATVHGMRAALLPTRWGGPSGDAGTVGELDDAALLPLFTAAEAHGVVLVLGGDVARPRLLAPEAPVAPVGAVELLARGADECQAFARIAYAGVLERFPALRVALRGGAGGAVLDLLQALQPSSASGPAPGPGRALLAFEAWRDGGRGGRPAWRRAWGFAARPGGPRAGGGAGSQPVASGAGNPSACLARGQLLATVVADVSVPIWLRSAVGPVAEGVLGWSTGSLAWVDDEQEWPQRVRAQPALESDAAVRLLSTNAASFFGVASPSGS
jgi:hypothetical protein